MSETQRLKDEIDRLKAIVVEDIEYRIKYTHVKEENDKFRKAFELILKSNSAYASQQIAAIALGQQWVSYKDKHDATT
jgi:cell shape-determining protein MreC